MEHIIARQRRAYQVKRPIESYDHRDKEPMNNPPVGFVMPETDRDASRKTHYLDHQLQWAGKVEHASFNVPAVSLNVLERIDPRITIEAARKRNSRGAAVQGSLWDLPGENPVNGAGPGSTGIFRGGIRVGD